MGKDNVRQVLEVFEEGCLLGLKLETILVDDLLRHLADDIQGVVELPVGMVPVRNVCDGGKGREDDSLLEVVMALEVTAELEDAAHRVLDSCGLGDVGDGLEEILKLTAEAVVDGHQMVGVGLVEARHDEERGEEIVCGEGTD